MNRHRDQLDEAIDRIAARITRVEENDAFASRIVSALPERSTWADWLIQSWAPRLAMIAIVVAAGIVWGRFASRDSNAVAQPLSFSQPLATPVTFVAGVRELMEPTKTIRLEAVQRFEPVEATAPGSDFEFSLPAIEAVAALRVEAVRPASIAEDAPLTLVPLAIADLPIAENISPR